MLYKPIKKMPNSKKSVTFANDKSKGKEINRLQYDPHVLEIEELNICGCGVKDISFIKKLKNLKRLYAHSNDILDLTPLKGLNIEVLHLQNNKIQNIEVLGTMPKLRYVLLFGNKIETVENLQISLPIIYEPIKQAENLSGVYLFLNPVADKVNYK